MEDGAEVDVEDGALGDHAEDAHVEEPGTDLAPEDDLLGLLLTCCHPALSLEAASRSRSATLPA